MQREFTMQWLTAITLRIYHDRRLTFLLIALAAVAGLSSISVMPRMEDPRMVSRAAMVTTLWPGADARRIESLITDKLEDRLLEVEGIKELRSASRPGLSTIFIELLDGVKDSEPLWSEIRGKLEDAIADLPVEADRPKFDDLKVRAYAWIEGLRWRRDSPPDYSILRRLAKDLEHVLQGVAGTERVERFGDPGEELLIEFDPDQLASIGLSGNELAVRLAASDAKNAAGVLRTGRSELLLELANRYELSSQLAMIPIQEGADGEFVRLGDLAAIRNSTPDPPPQFASISGDPGIVVAALARDDARIDLWSRKVRSQLDAFAGTLPEGVELETLMDQSRYVSTRLDNLAWNLLFSAIGVVLVVWWLMGWRSAITVSATLPIVVCLVLFALRGLGIPIHQMSVMGLIVALGLLIDNAIVVADEVSARVREGSSPTAAIAEVTQALFIPLVASTVTTILAFAPIALMPGPAGEFVSAIAISVILSVTISLAVAITFTAAISARTLGRVAQTARPLSGAWVGNGWSNAWLTAAYARSLGWLYDRPVLGIAICLAPPIIGFAVFPLLPEQFFPPADRDQFRIDLELPVQASIFDTESAAAQVDDALQSLHPRRIDWFFGESAPTFYYNVLSSRRNTPNYAQAIIQVDDIGELPQQLARLQSELDRKLPQARVIVRQFEQGPPFEAPIELRLFGPDLDRLREIGDQMRGVLATVPGVVHTRSLLSETIPKLQFDVDEESARLASLTPGEVVGQLSAALEGQGGGKVLEDTEEVPVRVRVRASGRQRLGQIESMELVSRAADGSVAWLPVSSLATTRLQPDVAVVTRLNQRRMNEVAGFLEVGLLPSIALGEFQRRWQASGQELPPGFELRLGGENLQRNNAVGNLLANVAVLTVAMLATLVLSFSSFRLAAVIVLIAILSVGLGMLGLWIGGYPFGFMAIIGSMGLIGVAINDSIVVQANLQTAISDQPLTTELAVDVVVRATRHVLATTLTTVAGFAPLIWSGGQFWPPLAVTIAGGVAGATVLALVLVPCLFRLLHPRPAVT
jgi:multidrug efflux pump subunit AcrB